MSIESQDFTPPTPPVKQPGFFRRHRAIVIVLISIVCLLAIAVVAAIVITTTAFVAVRNGCLEKDNYLQTASNSLETRLKKISIDGYSPSEVSVRKNGDCLTGTGAFGTASFFSLSYSSTVEANKSVTRSLNTTTPQVNQPFILGDDDGDGIIEFIQAKFIDGTDHAAYEVRYYLVDTLTCPDHSYESSICVAGETSKDMQKYTSKPINKIELRTYGS